MKKVLFTFVPALVIGVISLTSMTHKPSMLKNKISESQSSEAGSTFCPVVGETKISETSLPDNEIAPYRHCGECKAGVFLEDKNGTSRCTFCGRSEK